MAMSFIVTLGLAEVIGLVKLCSAYIYIYTVCVYKYILYHPAVETLQAV